MRPSSGSPLGSGIDWGFATVPQDNADGRSVYWPRGKMLGGSSGLNFLVSTRPNKAELDQWASLSGSWSWSWNSLFGYFMKSERFFSPSATKPEGVTATSNKNVHGRSGPVSVSYPPYLGEQNNGFYQAVQQMGVPVAQDLHTGSNHGVNLSPSTEHDSGNDRTRSYSVDYRALSTLLHLPEGGADL
jgi:choline dehydrogenase-like flavoprotein